MDSPNYIDLRTISGLRIELKYASLDNFMLENLYEGRQECLLHPLAAEKLIKAVHLLNGKVRGHRLIIYDALRPHRIQLRMWEKVKGTASEAYVAAPEPGSLHNYGLAVDCSILGPEGMPLDMGASFDDFRPIAEPRLEAKYLASGELNRDQYHNRLLLRDLMSEAGFFVLPNEWWHFEALPRDLAFQNYPRVP